MWSRYRYDHERDQLLVSSARWSKVFDGFLGFRVFARRCCLCGIRFEKKVTGTNREKVVCTGWARQEGDDARQRGIMHRP